MGFGQIVGGGPAGRYTLAVDYGAQRRDALLAALDEQRIKLEGDLAAAQVRLSTAQANAEAAQQAVADATNAFIAAGGTGNLSDTAVQAALLFLEQQRKAVIEAQKLTLDDRVKVDALRVALAHVLDLIARLSAAVVSRTREVWCTDYTESGAGFVATVDIDGAPDLTLIAPGCRAWSAGDGLMTATDVMSPEQAFVSAAILPGWQKFKPTYRWGTIAALDKDANTATVNLHDATSSAQGLGINQSATLSNIPVVYMTCNARAFEVNDRVVVQFLGQDWSNPRVIGFLDNPRPCLTYVASYYVIGLVYRNDGNQDLLFTLERGKDEDWGAVTTLSPDAAHRFVSWSDGNTSLTRDDGKATANISRTARYAFAPGFRLTYSVEVEAVAISGVYFSGGNFVKDWEVRATGSYAWTVPGYPAATLTPGSGTIDTVMWTGQAISGVSPDTVLQELTDTWTGLTSTPGPIYLPSFPTGTSASVTIQMPGSSNIYSVTGSAASDPAPGGAMPATSSNPAAFSATLNYTPTSWSATY